MRKLWFVVVTLVLVASACGVGGSNERTILVDYTHDEFSTFMLFNFPSKVTVSPGTSLVFKQTWTGEPHTVTGGKLVDEMMAKAKPLIDLFTGFETLMSSGADLPDPETDSDATVEDLFDAVEAADDEEAKEQFISGYDALREKGLDLPDRRDPGDASLSDIDEAIGPAEEEVFENSGIPWALDENEERGGFITQNGGQPCFLTKGGPPKDADEPCTDAQQRQPAFDGTATYYNSGIIPYEGPQGNTFRVDLAPDVDPGNYFFYCAVHGPGQLTEVEVTDDASEADSQAEINRRAREEIATFSEPMEELYDDARDGAIEHEGETIEGPFAGLSPPVHAAINAFVPNEIRTKVGDEVTWKIMGSDHTITFDVPKYFPIMTFATDGTVALNDKLQEPAGGSPELSRDEPDEGEVYRVDGGTYDGSGFFSSGLFGGEPYAEYTLRFSEAGTYKYACLLHPPMVGTVVVS